MRRLSLLAALALVLLTGGCQQISGLAARLFPPPPRPQPAATVPAPPPPLQADRVVVFKRRRILELLRGDEIAERFPIALGEHPEGAKRRQGDGRTPEGSYVIDWRTDDTRYTRELHISYPDAADRERAEARHVAPGGGIFIHGLPRDYGPFDPPEWYRDWTDGCIAVGNAAIIKISQAVPNGTPIDILP